MKNLFSTWVILLISATVWAQSPDQISYQAVIRDGNNALVTSTTVGVQISILQGSANGSAVYVESHTPSSNANGLVSLQVGTGTILSGNFSTIDWANGPYFIQTETDPTGGTNYTISGTSQILSVPYALHATTATRAINDSVNVYTAGNGIDINNNEIALNSPCGYSIGDTVQGGIVFHLDATGCHGLVADIVDLQAEEWGDFNYIGASASSVGGGRGNCRIVQEYNFDIGYSGASAPQTAVNYNTQGFNNWYLPSLLEVQLMYDNIGPGNLLGLGNVGGFAIDTYWSSTEYGYVDAYGFDFTNGSEVNAIKDDVFLIRAVRAF